MKSGETVILQITKAPAGSAPPTPPASATAAAVPAAAPAAAAASTVRTAPAAAPAPAAPSSSEDDGMYDDPGTPSGPPDMVAAMAALVAGSDAPTARLGLETLTKVGLRHVGMRLLR